jgi:CO/xanthine dehydrogenase FAD-binding subunit
MSATFAAPTELADALALLAADPAARPVAGGTDLVVASRQGRRPLPASIVAIDRIAALAEQRVDDGALILGSLTTHAWLASSPDVRRGWTALADAAAIVGSPATRGTGTLGGNLMNASPAAETTAPLVVFGATVVLASAAGGTRQIPVAELAVGPGRTSAAAGELLTEIHVPGLPPASGSAYIRLEYRQAMEIAVVGAAAFLALDGNRVLESRIALTAVGPTVFRTAEAEAVLDGGGASPSQFREAGRRAAAAARPIDDVRASADYRRAMVEVVVARTLAAAAARARGAAVPVPASRWAHGQEI